MNVHSMLDDVTLLEFGHLLLGDVVVVVEVLADVEPVLGY